jgi:hypothetical protein
MERENIQILREEYFKVYGNLVKEKEKEKYLIEMK